MTKATGQQIKQALEAICQAFHRAELAEMLQCELDKNLDDLLGQDAMRGMSYHEVSFRVLTIANRRGWLSDLLRAARRARPNNSTLQCEAITQFLDADQPLADQPLHPIKQICDALCEAFDEDEFAQMLRLELNKNLHDYVAPDSLGNMVFKLVTIAERGEWLSDLLRAARVSNPGNRSLRCEAITQVIGSGQPLQPTRADPTPPAKPRVPASELKRRLRMVLLEQFEKLSDLEILVSDCLDKRLLHVATGGNVVEICFTLVSWLWVDRAGRLHPLITGAVRERPNNDELKALQRELSAG
jgi:hypothetical protein